MHVAQSALWARSQSPSAQGESPWVATRSHAPGFPPSYCHCNRVGTWTCCTSTYQTAMALEPGSSTLQFSLAKEPVLAEEQGGATQLTLVDSYPGSTWQHQSIGMG